MKVIISRKYCVICKQTIESAKEIKATGHKWDDGIITQNATSLEKGEKMYNCNICGVTKKATKTMVYKAKNLKKKKAVFAIGAKAKTKLTYSISGKAKKYISVSSGGKVTLKKGCKKGIYKITITAIETKRYAKATKQVMIKVK